MRHRVDRVVTAALVAALAVTFGIAGLELRDTAHAAAVLDATPILRADIGARQAVSGDRVARAAPDPCRRDANRQLVVVNVHRQHAWARAGRRIVLSTPVTTGAVARHGDATPHGSFAVEGHVRDTTLTTSADGSYHVRYWIPFRAGIWGFHDAPWQRIRFGSHRYRRHGSHGCVHVPLAAMRQLYRWVDDGTRVRVR